MTGLFKAILENEHLRVEVKPHGAEMTSLLKKGSSGLFREWLWHGDSKYWGRQAPVLFPVIGALKDGGYYDRDQFYALPKHGFARDHVFQLMEQSHNHLAWRLVDNAETRGIYPQSFELWIRYFLEAAVLHVEYEVVNASGEDPLWFSLGAHPAFAANYLKEAWQLAFEHPERLETRLVDLETGLIRPETAVLMHGEPIQTLPLSAELFRQDALIFKDLNSSWVRLERVDQSESMTFFFDGFPRMAFWSPEAPFVCLEPWFGIADGIHATGRIEDKPERVILSPGESFACRHSMMF